MRSEKKQNQSRKAKKPNDFGTFIVFGFIIGALIGIVTGIFVLRTDRLHAGAHGVLVPLADAII